MTSPDHDSDDFPRKFIDPTPPPDHEGCDSRGGEPDGCGFWNWMVVALLYTGLWALMASLPPIESIPGLQELLEDPRYIRDEPTTCSVELVGVKGLDQPAALAPPAASPAFDLVVHVENGHNYVLQHQAGDVVISYAGVPLARGVITRRFCLAPKQALALPVKVTGEGVGLPKDLFRLVMAERRWGVAQLEIDVGLASESFTCDVLVDGLPRTSACRLSINSIPF